MVRLLVATWRPAFGLRATSSVLKEGGMFARFALLFIESFQTALTLSLLLAVLFSANPTSPIQPPLAVEKRLL